MIFFRLNAYSLKQHEVFGFQQKNFIGIWFYQA
jgi:hypothetical protein